MNSLVFGANGFLGQQIRIWLPGLCGFEVQGGLPTHTFGVAHAEPQAWNRLLDSLMPDAVVKCTGRMDVRDILHALTSDLSGVVNVGSGQVFPARDLVDGLLALFSFRGQFLEAASSSSDVPCQRANFRTC